MKHSARIIDLMVGINSRAEQQQNAELFFRVKLKMDFNNEERKRGRAATRNEISVWVQLLCLHAAIGMIVIRLMIKNVSLCAT